MNLSQLYMRESTSILIKRSYIQNGSLDLHPKIEAALSRMHFIGEKILIQPKLNHTDYYRSLRRKISTIYSVNDLLTEIYTVTNVIDWSYMTLVFNVRESCIEVTLSCPRLFINSCVRYNLSAYKKLAIGG